MRGKWVASTVSIILGGGTIPLASMNGGILASGTLLDAFAPGGKIWGISMKRGLRRHVFSQQESLSFNNSLLAPDLEANVQSPIPIEMFLND
ncbi:MULTISPECIES: hypothetical protein [Paraburkholderia]|uniref:hypothetical protein n=1 Tax=Paraburkholderia TaxID=1822464 RepID=UPI00101A8704|nr:MULTISPECIES: hypothetical protein [Paraburkholderia]